MQNQRTGEIGLTRPLIPENIFTRLGSRLFRVELRLEERLCFPEYPGVTVRGGFGYALRRLVCPQPEQPCGTCTQRFSCAYSFLFETPVPPELPTRRTFDKAPHPIVLRCNPGKRLLDTGECVTVDLLLIGHAVGHLPTCLLALSRLGRMGLGRDNVPFKVVRVVDIDDGDEVFGDSQAVQLRAPMPFKPAGDQPVQELREVEVVFRSPVQFRNNGRVARSIPFHLLIRNLLRRFSLLSLFHAGRDPDLDYRGLIKQAESVVTAEEELHFTKIERYSTRQKRRIAMHALKGSVIYRGDVATFTSLLSFGERFHAGRGTSFGMGWMTVNVAGERASGAKVAP